MGLFGLGRKKYDKMSVEEMLAALQDARKKENEVKIAELFWEIANRYQKEGKDEKALSYLHQFDDFRAEGNQTFVLYGSIENQGIVKKLNFFIGRQRKTNPVVHIMIVSCRKKLR